jgi:hypothetical protein
MAEDWTRTEVEAIVADYFTMLTDELRGEEVNKTAHNRRLQAVTSRSHGSIEFKHANISAVLIESGFPYIDGYKPRRNVQGLLREVVAERLATALDLERAVADAVIAPVTAHADEADILSVLVPAPEREGKTEHVYEGAGRTARGQRANYLAQEATNRELGSRGEEFVVAFEHARLWKEGARALADRIEHVARTKGDGFGFDVLSYETNGEERLIEVKTTRFGLHTPFYASRNEVAVSDERRRAYFVYRLCKFSRDRKLFLLNGSIRETCSLEPTQFLASVA